MDTKSQNFSEEQLDQALVNFSRNIHQAKKNYYIRMAEILKRIDDRKIKEIKEKIKE